MKYSSRYRGSDSRHKGEERWAGEDPFAPQPSDDEYQGLTVVGYTCTLFRDDGAASAIHDEGHMIPWMGDSDIMLDRCDIAHFLFC